MLSLRRFSTRILGYATAEGTDRFAHRSRKVDISHFRSTHPSGLSMSSLAIGTYLGPADSTTDELVHSAIVTSVKSGAVNHIDTASNYRYRKAERCVGKALRTLEMEGIERSEYFVASKIGFVPEDIDTGETASAGIQRYIEKFALSKEDFVHNSCLHPVFLKDQLTRSLDNLGIDCLDILYLHNPVETHLSSLGKLKFFEKLAKAIEFCESAVRENKVKNYGLATWKCFRTQESDVNFYASLAEIVELAEKVAGPDNALNYIQIPINVAMPEAWVCKWQSYENSHEIFLNIAKKLKLNVIISSPFFHGKTVDVKLSKMMMNVESQGAKHIQFLRSIPSTAIKSVIVGMKKPEHVLMNTQVAYVEPVYSDNFWSYLKPEGHMDSKVDIKLW